MVLAAKRSFRPGRSLRRERERETEVGPENSLGWEGKGGKPGTTWKKDVAVGGGREKGCKLIRLISRGTAGI